MKQNESVKVVAAPNALQNPLYQLVKKAVKAANLRKSLVGTKEEVLAKAAKMNAKNRHFIMPTDCKPAFDEVMRLIQNDFKNKKGL